MASYKGVQGAMTALRDFLQSRLPPDMVDGTTTTNARVVLLGSSDIAKPLTGNILGVYLYRLAIDDHGRTRTFRPQGSDNSPPRPELPVNLHFLLIANAGSATLEADLMSWAMVELANHSQLDISHVQDVDDEWGQSEVLSITPVDLTTEDLMRIWDVFETPYTSTMAYIAKTVRLRLNPPRSEGPEVVTRVFPTGVPA